MELSPLAREGRDYLIGRGFQAGTLSKFMLGQMMDPRRMIEDGSSRWGERALVEAGIVRQTDRGLRSLFAADTVLFGFLSQGKLKYVQGRSIRADAPYRWLNPANLSKPLFNEDALDKARLGKLIHLCEGVTDTMAATQLGRLAVGVLGSSSLTPTIATQFDGLNVVILPDGDTALDIHPIGIAI